MRHKIRKWLADPEKKYQSGLDLFKETKHTNQFDNFFQSHHDPPAASLPFKMLVQQLSNIIRIMEQYPEPVAVVPENPLIKAKPIKTPVLKINAADKKSVKILNKIDLKKLPENLKEKYNRTKVIVPEMNAVQQEMRDAANDDDRKFFAEKLVALEEEKDECWKAIDDYVAAEGAKPSGDIPNPVAVALKKKVRIDNLKIYIGRETKKPANPKSIKKIEEWKNELTELEK